MKIKINEETMIKYVARLCESGLSDTFQILFRLNDLFAIYRLFARFDRDQIKKTGHEQSALSFLMFVVYFDQLSGAART